MAAQANMQAPLSTLHKVMAERTAAPKVAKLE